MKRKTLKFVGWSKRGSSQQLFPQSLDPQRLLREMYQGPVSSQQLLSPHDCLIEVSFFSVSPKPFCWSNCLSKDVALRCGENRRHFSEELAGRFKGPRPATALCVGSRPGDGPCPDSPTGGHGPNKAHPSVDDFILGRGGFPPKAKLKQELWRRNPRVSVGFPPPPLANPAPAPHSFQRACPGRGRGGAPWRRDFGESLNQFGNARSLRRGFSVFSPLLLVLTKSAVPITGGGPKNNVSAFFVESITSVRPLALVGLAIRPALDTHAHAHVPRKDRFIKL